MIDRDEAIKRIRTALKERSDRAWSVTGGRGTGWGWIRIVAPPRRRDGSCMTAEDAAELGRLLGYKAPIHRQGASIPAGSDYREEFIARAEGRVPAVLGEPYWD